MIFQAIFYPPGWTIGVPVHKIKLKFNHFQVHLFFHWATLKNPAHDVPVPENPPIVYNPPLSAWLKAYLLAHFLLLLAIFMHFEYDRDELDWPDFGLKLAFFICSSNSKTTFLTISFQKCNPLVPSLTSNHGLPISSFSDALAL